MMHRLLLAASFVLGLGAIACTEPAPAGGSAQAIELIEPTETAAPVEPGDGQVTEYDDHCALPGEVPVGGFFQDKDACEKRSGEIKDGKATCKTGDKKGTRCKWNKNTGPGDKGVCVCYVDEPAGQPTPTDTQVDQQPIGLDQPGAL